MSVLTGTLIKLVYFSRKRYGTATAEDKNGKDSVIEGRLHFAKFETSKINDCLDFILLKKLHLGGMCVTVFMIVAICKFSLLV